VTRARKKPDDPGNRLRNSAAGYVTFWLLLCVLAAQSGQTARETARQRFVQSLRKVRVAED
jgi:hypothetical protein